MYASVQPALSLMLLLLWSLSYESKNIGSSNLKNHHPLSFNFPPKQGDRGGLQAQTSLALYSLLPRFGFHCFSLCAKQDAPQHSSNKFGSAFGFHCFLGSKNRCFCLTMALALKLLRKSERLMPLSGVIYVFFIKNRLQPIPADAPTRSLSAVRLLSPLEETERGSQYSKLLPPKNSRRREVGGIWSSGMGLM